MRIGSIGITEWLGAAAAVGPLVAGLGVVITLVGLASGCEPIGHEPLTLAEAAALGRRPEILAAHRRGADLAGRYPVRRELFGTAQPMTPLEAAVAARREETVAYLLTLDERLASAAERTRLACAALSAEGSEQVVEALFPSGFDRTVCPPR